MLGEKILRSHIYSCLLMIAGSMLALAFTSKHTEKYDIRAMKHRLLSVVSIATLVIIFFMMATFYLLSFRIIRDIKKMSKYFTAEQREN